MLQRLASLTLAIRNDAAQDEGRRLFRESRVFGRSGVQSLVSSRSLASAREDACGQKIAYGIGVLRRSSGFAKGLIDDLQRIVHGYGTILCSGGGLNLSSQIVIEGGILSVECNFDGNVIAEIVVQKKANWLGIGDRAQRCGTPLH